MVTIADKCEIGKKTFYCDKWNNMFKLQMTFAKGPYPESGSLEPTKNAYLQFSARWWFRKWNLEQESQLLSIVFYFLPAVFVCILFTGRAAHLR